MLGKNAKIEFILEIYEANSSHSLFTPPLVRSFIKISKFPSNEQIIHKISVVFSASGDVW